MATIKPLVSINLGISLLPLRAVLPETRRRELHYVKISDKKLFREIGLVCHRSDYHPKVLAELIDYFAGTHNFRRPPVVSLNSTLNAGPIVESPSPCTAGYWWLVRPPLARSDPCGCGYIP